MQRGDQGAAGATAELARLRGRAATDLEEARFAGYVSGARVLVTGAGGSLGRELCRRLAGLGAGAIALVDQAEAALVDIYDELRFELGFAGARPVLADLRSPARARGVVEEHRPQIVFHTAAYKLVPVVEAHPVEAVANNVLATRVLVEAAAGAGAGRFVLYSTDKAIRPANVLGRTKALAECIVGTAARQPSATRFACIRLGNALESSGSMLPLFRRQLAAARPVTVTDSRMTRYVMTIGETASLALVAGALANRGDVFRLDMGLPVRVVDAARAAIRASGDGHNATVEMIGSRPGEKLHEDLEAPDEPVWRTEHERVVRCGPRYADADWLGARLERLRELVADADADGARAELERIVPGIRVDSGTEATVGV
jgi:FlaA1/EpsC-like NDP-sugar epimerase